MILGKDKSFIIFDPQLVSSKSIELYSLNCILNLFKLSLNFLKFN